MPVHAGDVTARKRGRPQRLPDDPSPFSGRHVGCDQRAAWLLATSRLMHPDPRVRERAPFIEALQVRGVPVDGPRISRWESGSQPVTRQVSAAYEDILGLGPGSLSAVTAGLRRTFGNHVSPRDQVVPDDRGDLETLLEDIEHGVATGSEWQRVAGSLTRHERVFLRRTEWQELSRELVHELGRSVGLAYVQRYEASVVLLRHPSSRGPMSRALGSYVMDPDTQVIAPVLNLLSEVHEQQDSELVLRLLHTDRLPLRRAAASVAADKLRRGHFDLGALPALEEHARQRLRHEDALEAGLDALDLSTQLPAASFFRIVDSIGDRRVRRQLERAHSTYELISPRQAAHVIAEGARQVQAEIVGTEFGEPDLLLRRLLREALFHTHKPRRHHAAVLLAASPYRHAVSHLCRTLTGASNYFLAARAWTVLMRVGHAGCRSDIALRALSEGRPALRGRALVNLGLDPDPISHGEARVIVAGLRDDEDEVLVRHGALFALGMSGAEELELLAAHGSDPVRRGSRWWLDHGPAIHDPFALATPPA